MHGLYHFNMPGQLVWGFHILMGAFLTYIGYLMNEKKDVPEFTSAILLIFGAMAVFYHAHIWLLG